MTEGGRPSLGDVWRYPFLWSREAAQGETEGRKARPVAMILLQRNVAGEIECLMVPITSRPPRDGAFALPVPEIEKRRAGLDVHLALWVVTDEANIDVPERSFYFEPGGRLGAFSIHFTKSVQAQMIQALRARKLTRTSRR